MFAQRRDICYLVLFWHTHLLFTWWWMVIFVLIYLIYFYRTWLFKIVLLLMLVSRSSEIHARIGW